MWQLAAGVLAVQAHQALSATVNVVVVGSGVSGLSAARTLVDNWPTSGETTLNVTVLEAGSRIGGRTYTRRSVPDWGAISGAEADVGASWIHGSCPEHPITRIYDALGLHGFVTQDSLDQVHQCEEDEDDECAELEDSRFGDYEELLEKADAHMEEQEGDASIYEAMRAVSDDYLSRDDPVIQYHTTNALEFNTGASPSDLSGKYYSDDLQYEGEERLILEGYGRVPEALASGSIRLSAVCRALVAPAATKITSSQVALNVKTGMQVTQVRQPEGQSGLEVVTADGGVSPADHVILAVPLGVLKAASVSFSPELPVATRTAISRVGFGDVVKIGLLFSRSFWPDDKHYFGIAPTGAGPLSRAERFSYYLNAQAAAERPILFTFAFGASALEVEELSEEEVQSGILANLRKIFGEDNMDGVTIVSMWRSSWGTDPLFRGAYSFSKVGSTPADWEALAAPAMDERLHFAGEHTSREYRGTVHGALFSGQRAACEVFEEALGAASVEQFVPGATTTVRRTSTTRRPTSTRTTTTTRTGTTTAKPPATITGSVGLSVADPAAFAASATAKAAVAQGLADVAKVKTSYVQVTLRVGGRRLEAHHRELSGTVTADFNISIPSGARVAGQSAQAALSSATTATLGSAIGAALAQRNFAGPVTVASAPALSLSVGGVTVGGVTTTAAARTTIGGTNNSRTASGCTRPVVLGGLTVAAVAHFAGSV